MTRMRFASVVVLLALSGCAGSSTSNPVTAPPIGQKKAGQVPPELVEENTARRLFETGKYQALLDEFADSTRPELIYWRAAALRRTGRLDEATSQLGLLQGVSSLPKSPADCPQSGSETTLWASRAMLLRGEIELEMGKRDQANSTVQTLIQCVRGPDATSVPAHLVYAGHGAHLIREHELANELFNAAETTIDQERFGIAYRDLLLYRGALFLDKNDHAQAEQIATELHEIRPDDPLVQLFVAELAAETRFDFAEAERRALSLLESDPNHEGALFLLAGIQLRDMNLSQAQKYVDRGLRQNPRDLDLLSMEAAVLFLSEKREAFAAQLERISVLSPGNVRPYLVVAEYAEWEHRYPDIEKLMRKATRIDRESAHVRTHLGLTLVRAGSDAAGVVELNRAYDLDPYNVRVINTLNLYETIIPRDYVSVRKGPFRYRFPKNEAELLERYVPALMERGYAEMRERYDYTPPAPIDVELYEAPEQFAVRTSGVPSIGIQGVCFGRKLATVSPIGSPGNLGMTLWHELGHVFHIGLSQFRVPRYLTEGLAEWETARRQIGWSRELDRELLEVRQSGGLPPLSHMSRAFTHARRAQDVAAAYYASGILSEWLVERFGEKRTVEVLAEMGRGKLPNDVIPRVLESSWDQLDAAFSAHLDHKLRPLEGQFTPQRPRDESQVVRPLLKKNPQDPELSLRLALALLAEGQSDEARPLLDELHKRKNDQATFALVRLALSQEKKKRARELLGEMFQRGTDGYELRMLSARLYLADQDDEHAAQEMEAAVRFDPTAEDPRGMLADYYKRHERPADELEQLRAWAKLSEHDPAVHRRLLQLLIEQNEIPEAVEAAQLAIWVDLAGVETHRLAGLAHARASDLKSAEFEWESALLCPARSDNLLILKRTWTAELNRRGLTGRAQRVISEIDRRIEIDLQKYGYQSPEERGQQN